VNNLTFFLPAYKIEKTYKNWIKYKFKYKKNKSCADILNLNSLKMLKNKKIFIKYCKTIIYIITNYQILDREKVKKNAAFTI
jgi:hypothetical protein